MSDDTTYQNTSAENVEVNDEIKNTTGPEGGTTRVLQQVDGENFDKHRVYYNTAAEYAPIDEEESDTVAANNVHVNKQADDKRDRDGNDTTDITSNHATNETPTENIRKYSAKKTRKVPSFYDDQLYSMVGPGDRTSNGSRYDKTPSSPSLPKKQRSKNKMKQCLKYGIPSLLVFLITVGVGITLHHFGMFPKMINIGTPGRLDHVYLCQHHSIIHELLYSKNLQSLVQPFHYRRAG